MKLHAPTTQEEAESMVTRGPSMETGWKIVTDRKRHSPEYLDGDWIVYHDSSHIVVLSDITFHKLYDITRFR